MIQADVKPLLRRRDRATIRRRKRTAPVNRAMPDGIPHRSIGLTAFIVVALAALLVAALIRRSTVLVVALVASVPIAILLLARNARRQRKLRARTPPP
jgi:hypothetical protein